MPHGANALRFRPLVAMAADRGPPPAPLTATAAALSLDQAVASIGPAGQVVVVRGDGEGEAPLGLETEEEVPDDPAGLGVQVARGLVREDQPGRPDEGAGDGHPLLLAAGQLSRSMAESLAQPHLRERRGRARARLVGRPPLEEGRQHGVLQGGHLAEEVRRTGTRTRPASAGGGRARSPSARRRPPPEQHPPGRRSIERSEQVEQGRLADPGRADDGDRLTRVHGYRDAAKHPDQLRPDAVLLLEVDGVEQGLTHTGARRPGRARRPAGPATAWPGRRSRGWRPRSARSRSR